MFWSNIRLLLLVNILHTIMVMVIGLDMHIAVDIAALGNSETLDVITLGNIIEKEIYPL